MAFVPGNENRLHAREVLVERGAPDARLFSDLRHRYRPQPMLGHERGGGVEDCVAHLAAVCLDGLVPELGDHARIRDDHSCDTLYCTWTKCLDKVWTRVPDSSGTIFVAKTRA